MIKRFTSGHRWPHGPVRINVKVRQIARRRRKEGGWKICRKRDPKLDAQRAGVYFIRYLDTCG